MKVPAALRVRFPPASMFCMLAARRLSRLFASQMEVFRVQDESPAPWSWNCLGKGEQPVRGEFCDAVCRKAIVKLSKLRA